MLSSSVRRSETQFCKVQPLFLEEYIRMTWYALKEKKNAVNIDMRLIFAYVINLLIFLYYCLSFSLFYTLKAKPIPETFFYHTF